jgi:ATP-dependent Lon protease
MVYATRSNSLKSRQNISETHNVEAEDSEHAHAHTNTHAHTRTPSGKKPERGIVQEKPREKLQKNKHPVSPVSQNCLKRRNGNHASGTRKKNTQHTSTRNDESESESESECLGKDESESEYLGKDESEDEYEGDVYNVILRGVTDEVDARMGEDSARDRIHGTVALLRQRIDDRRPDLVRVLQQISDVKHLSRLTDVFAMYSSEDATISDVIEYREMFHRRWMEATASERIDLVVARVLANNGKPSDVDRSQLDEIMHDVEKEDDVFDSGVNDALKLRIQLARKNVSLGIRRIIEKKIDDMLRRGKEQEEFSKSRDWIEWILKIPFEDLVPFPPPDTVELILRSLASDLDKYVFGMRDVKERILVTVNTRLRNPEARSASLGLVGPPGVGQTMICRLIAQALGFPMKTISFGGIDRVEYLQGHESTYIGSNPGEFVRCLCEMGVKNGILLLDEYDNAASTPTVLALMLHVTDPENNHDNFRDHYFPSVPIDLSKLWFLYSMNWVPNHPAFRDRFVTVNVPAYSNSEKVGMLQKYILPSVLREEKLEPWSLTLDDEAALELVRASSENTPGVRQLRFKLMDVVQKILFVMNNPSLSTSLNAKFVHSKQEDKVHTILRSAHDQTTCAHLSFPFVISRDFLARFMEDRKPAMDTHMYT